MESLVKTVDAATLEQTATKAKVIRADLEAASKARNKLAATYKKEDSKMIQELHTQLMELEGMSQYLPALVERLQQLASLHVQAGTFSSRLEALETSANQLSSSVSSVEGTMEQLASNLTQNLKTMESNLQALDERLKKL
jgi:chromosome segregation ATPase